MERNFSKEPSKSYVEMTELVLPDDTNLLGNLLGGRLMHWMDIAGALSASKHSNKVVATASVDNIEFNHPIKLGEMVILKAKVIFTGRTSMDLKIDVYSENVKTGKRIYTNKAYMVFVALDDKGKPSPVPTLKPITDQEIEDYEFGLKKRKERLSKR